MQKKNEEIEKDNKQTGNRHRILMICIYLFVFVMLVVITGVRVSQKKASINNQSNSIEIEEQEKVNEDKDPSGSEQYTFDEINEETLKEITQDLPEVEGLYEKTDKPRNPEEVKAFAEAYGGVWYLTKEYSEELKSWSYHDLEKKLLIMAWNRFNDGSYQEIVGSYEEDLGEWGYYYNGKWICVKDNGSRKRLIYGDTVHTDGIDIKYHEKYIILTETDVDLSGIGGPIFSLEDFRYEKIWGYDYLISDIYGFGLVWDGTYLEYCEPKEDNGYYQGIYAFRTYNIDELINQDYNDDEY